MKETDLALRLADVRHGYPRLLGFARTEVLRGVDLQLARGRTLGLAGPNGSGKSTILRLLAGIERPHSGTITVLGRDPRASGVVRRVGYLAEDSPFPPELSALGALELLGAVQGLARRDVKTEAPRLLEIVGLKERARSTLSSFSRGMMRRFGLAQAWLCRPELVLLDEPTAGLDALGYEALAELLADAKSRRATVVLASHLSDDFREHADELAVVLDGRIAHHGECAQLLRATNLSDLYRTARA